MSDYYPLGAYEQYMSKVRHTPRLSLQRELHLFDLLAQARRASLTPSPDRRVLALGDLAFSELVERYQPLVMGFASRFVRFSKLFDVLDLAQEGTIGLMAAIRRHDVSRGYSVAGFASYHIRREMVRALWGRDAVVRVSETERALLRQIALIEQRVLALAGREPSCEEYAGEMLLDRQKVVALLELRYVQSMISLQGLFEDGQAEQMCSFRSPFAAELPVPTTSQQEMLQVVCEALPVVLSQQQRDVVMLRYGLGHAEGCFHSFAETATLMGLSIGAVEQLERAALVRLRERLDLVIENGRPVCRLRQASSAAYYTVQEAALQLGRSPSAVFNALYRGKLPSVRCSEKTSLYLIPKEAVDALAFKQREKRSKVAV